MFLKVSKCQTTATEETSQLRQIITSIEAIIDVPVAGSETAVAKGNRIVQHLRECSKVVSELEPSEASFLAQLQSFKRRLHVISTAGNSTDVGKLVSGIEKVLNITTSSVFPLSVPSRLENINAHIHSASDTTNTLRNDLSSVRSFISRLQGVVSPQSSDLSVLMTSVEDIFQVVGFLAQKLLGKPYHADVNSELLTVVKTIIANSQEHESFLQQAAHVTRGDPNLSGSSLLRALLEGYQSLCGIQDSLSEMLGHYTQPTQDVLDGLFKEVSSNRKFITDVSRLFSETTVPKSKEVLLSDITMAIDDKKATDDLHEKLRSIMKKIPHPDSNISLLNAVEMMVSDVAEHQQLQSQLRELISTTRSIDCIKTVSDVIDTIKEAFTFQQTVEAALKQDTAKSWFDQLTTQSPQTATERIKEVLSELLSIR
eukprot:TRINITY_DN25575_c0_g1_i1.p1 TRINITY_DN25575_c0_g1~~TRINITY_DN25575_c0_g1_i1.p1  ORF type:complete len:427 (+),score=95.96 TRINITY_DN25575_c0_g1_i1:9-1289(+)